MQVSSKLLFKTAVVGLALVLMLGLFLALGSTREAGAVTAGTQWNTLRGYVDSFFTGQYVADGVNGESGFTINRSTLKSLIDSNGDMSPTGTNVTTTVTGVLGEGDNAANAPVLVDNIVGNPQVIPGTSVRCNWNGGYGTTTADNCFDSPKVTDIANRVNAHEAAGFSTDIVVYCVSGRTESVTAGGLGTLAQTGALGGTSAPNVLAFKWGRQGWNAISTTTTSTAGSTGSVSAPSTTYPDGTGSATICSGAATDAELVRCTAQWAVYSGTGNTANWLTPSATAAGAGYAIGNGVATLTSSNQVIDIRTPSPATTATVTGGPTTLQIPINTLFGSGVNFMNTRTTTTKNVFVGRTQHVAGMAAVNAVMLGYNSSFLAFGVNAWNTILGGESYQTSVAGSMDTPAYPYQTATASSEWSGVDTTAPSIIVGSAASGVTPTSATIARGANEPATMKIEYGTTSGGPYTNTVNDTVLNASKVEVLSGLSENTTYYVKVTNYDGQANGTTESQFSFTTPCSVGKPPLTLATHYAYWASPLDYGNGDLSVVYKVTAGAINAYNVAITGSSNTNSVTLLTATPASVGNIAATTTSSITLKYDIPTGVTQFNAALTGSGENQCAMGYTYP